MRNKLVHHTLRQSHARMNVVDPPIPARLSRKGYSRRMARITSSGFSIRGSSGWKPFFFPEPGRFRGVPGEPQPFPGIQAFPGANPKESK